MCSKLEDTETILPALSGIKSLVSQPVFTSSDALEVVNALFAHVTMRVLVQSQRYVVFNIIDALVARHRQALKSMNEEFLTGYVALAEGEKDPRNLLLAFAIARVLLIEFDITHHTEQLFNITFCYFPITFRPPPDDPYGITTDDLRKALRECLSATPLFGPLAIPLFLEKLTAGSPVTKRDTLQTLDICLPVYGSSTARKHAKELWNTLKLEATQIFQPTDLETEVLALKTTQVLVRTIYDSHNTDIASDPQIEGLAKDACDECVRILKEPEKSQAKPATKVLCAFMSTTPSVARFTLEQVVPHLVKLFLNPDEVQNRGAVLQALADVIDAARHATILDLTTDSETSIPIAPYKDEVLGVLTVGLKVPSGCRHALVGLLSMVNTLKLLTDEELGFVVHNVNEILSEGDVEDEDVSDAILDLLTVISSLSSRHVVQTTLPMLFTSLPDSAPPRVAESDRMKYWRTLSFLKRLCIQPDLFETLVIRLSTKLDLLCTAPMTSDEVSKDTEPTAAYAHSLLRTLADALAKKESAGHVDIAKYLDRLIPRLFSLHVHTVFRGNHSLTSDPRLISVTAEIITLVVQVVSPQKQEAFLKNLFAAFIDGDITKIVEGQQKFAEDVESHPFSQGNASSSQKSLVPLFCAALVPLHKEVVLPVANESAFLDQLLRWCLTVADNVTQVDAVLHAVVSVLNKRAEVLGEFLNEHIDRIWSDFVATHTVAQSVRRTAIAAWAWITKALLARGDPHAQSFTDRLFTLFDDPDISWDAARAIGQVVSHDKALTKKHHAIIKFLFAQKFANTMLPRLIEGAQSSTQPAIQNAHLVALASLIKSIPKTAYAHQMSALMPLLLRGLELPDYEIRVNVIQTLSAVADSTSKENGFVVEHASSLVTTMLKNSTVENMPSMVRF
ncbi:hypothetical protein EIP86_009241 [Pleurotus ostreatoroseus]|nr:hypothetical protein EIP86_009241 [Pleurotus ostreatoroseus]